MKTVAASLIATIVFLFITSCCLATTYYVNGTTGDDSYDGLASTWDGTHGPKKTIQAGINAASGSDTVIVADGTYTGAGNLGIEISGKIITVESENGPEACIIDCENSGRAFYLYNVGSPGALIEGFGITRGLSSLPGDDGGGGVLCEESLLTLTNCIITDCEASGYGGAVCSRTYSMLALENCVLMSNSAGVGGGGVYSGQSSAFISDCTITGNDSGTYGGGVMIGWWSYGEMTGSILWSNSSPDGAQLAVRLSSDSTVSYSDVEGGSAAVYVYSSTLTWGDGNIDQDPSVDATGHLLISSPCIDWCPTGLPADCDGETRPFDVPGTGYDGTRKYDIGADEYVVTAIYVNGADGDDAWDGFAPVWDGAHGPKKTIQAGIDAASEGNEVIVADGTYTGTGNRDMDFLGKAITVRSENGPQNCVIDCQNAGRAFYMLNVGSPGAVIEGFSITRGMALTIVAYGGGVFCEGSLLTVRNCIVTECEATESGGGISCRDFSSLTVENCVFSGNSSGSRAGGIHAEESSLYVENCTVVDNTAGEYGGGVMLAWGAYGEVVNTIVWSNTAPNGNNIALKAVLNPSTLTVSYSDVKGGETAVHVDTGCTLTWGDGNIDEDPLLDSNWRLDLDSPCIDWCPAGPAIDLMGENRPFDVVGKNFDGTRTYDIGADEYVDTDEDGLPDWYEIEKTGSPTAMDANGDDDSDDLTNLDEFRAGTDPFDDDTDGDGSKDGREVNVTGTDPLDPDSDDDGLLDGVETDTGVFSGPSDTGTDPLDPDSDNDGYLDGWEVTHGYNPTISDPHITEIHVIPGGSIQEAIDLAENGDTVIVEDGVYTGEGNRDIEFFGKAIIVRSENGPENCIIDCEGTDADLHRAFYFHAGETQDSVLEGFTMRNGYEVVAGAILCTSSPVIRDCIMVGNTGMCAGGGLFLGGGAVVENCAIVGNRVLMMGLYLGEGGGVCCRGSGATMTRCLISGNRGICGGGIGILHGDMEITDCYIAGNTSQYEGGAVWYFNHMDPTQLRILDSVLCGNRCSGLGMGGGAVCWAAQLPSESGISNCTLAYNGSGAGDGAILWSCSGDNSVLTNNILWNNEPQEVTLHFSSHSLTLEYSDVKGGTGEDWFGEGCIDTDPGFDSGPSGTWTSAGAYDPNTLQVTFTDAGASWEVNELAGMLLNPDTSQPLQFYIVGNTENTITVWADWQTVDDGTSWVTSGASYQVYDYRLASGSPCIDTGTNDAPDLASHDLDGNLRVWFGGTSWTVDMGAYEYGSVPLAVTSMTLTTEGHVQLTWNSSVIAGASYTVEYSDDEYSDSMTWNVLVTGVPSAGSETSYTDTTAPAGTSRYYRILDEN